MNCKRRLEDYLRENAMPYQTQHHPRAITAQEVAATEHVPGRMFAKTVMVTTDGGEEVVMLVLPAPYHVDPKKAAEAVGAHEARIAEEGRFARTFADREVRAMSPFGNLYGVSVYVDETLAQDETIVFRAGTHTDTMSVPYADFERPVEPTIAHFADPRAHDPALGMGQVERRWAPTAARKRTKRQAGSLRARNHAGRHGRQAGSDRSGDGRMKESAREGLLVDGAGAPLAEEDSGSVELLDGTSVPYRAIAPDNAAALQRFHHRLSDRSIYLRFFGAKPNLSDRKAGYFTNVDGTNRFALVALDPEREGEIIAVVSFDREGTTERAEYAAAVEDRWQGRELGLALTRRLIEAALKRGIRVLTGVVLFENARMLHLLRDLGLPERLRYEGGVEHVEIGLSPPKNAPDRAEEASGPQS